MAIDWSLLINRRIIGILIGDQSVYQGYSFPYMKGSDLCDLSTTFGLPKTYDWGGGGPSRWEYMRDLLAFLNSERRIPELLLFLIQKRRFDHLVGIGDIKTFDKTYSAIVQGAIDAINAQLVLARVELRYINNSFGLVEIGEEVSFETPLVSQINSPYINGLPDRIKVDIENKDYDSAITKSRTLLEEVLIHIIEQLTSESYKSSGDLVKIYQDATKLLNMRQKKEWDKRVNDLLGGLHKIVNSISSMRNLSSDAHGAGVGRININKREAILVAKSSAMLAEYWLSFFENKG